MTDPTRSSRTRLRAMLTTLAATALLPLVAAAQSDADPHPGLVARAGRWLTPAQAAANPGRPPIIAAPDWGIAGTSTYSVGACDASSRDYSLTYSALNCDTVFPITTGTDVAFPIHLPSGALIVSATLDYQDTVDADPSVAMYQNQGDGTGVQIMDMTPPPFNGGHNAVTFLADPPFPVSNSHTYVILAILQGGHGIHSIQVRYKLQVTAAPATATFTDVDTSHPLFRFVEALAAAGITAGCGGGKFCPDQPLTRGQMAVLLSKALGLYFPN
jgi:S-layer homology domain